MNKNPLSRIGLLLVRITLVIAPFAWVAWHIDFRSLGRAIHDVSWWCLPSMTLFTTAIMLLQAVRWHILLKAYITRLSALETIGVYFKSLFYSLVLPTSAAQDVVRAVILSRREDYRVVWGSAWVGRLLGLGVLSVLASAGLIFLDERLLVPQLKYAIGGSAVAIVVLVFLSFSKAVTRRVRPLLQRLLPEKIAAILEGIREGIYLYRQRMPSVLAALGVTVITQLLVVTNATIVVGGISGQFPFLALMIIIPVIEIVCMSLPLTPSGIGVRDSLVLLLFAHLGLTHEQIAVYMAIVLYGIILRLMGGIPVVLETFKRRAEPRDADRHESGFTE